MKHFSILLAFTLFILDTNGQGAITAIAIQPANPTVNDQIEILVDLQFAYSSCDADYQDHGLQGSTIIASAHHCVGMLAAICNTTDTFQIGQLPAGNYTFDMTLSSGFGGPGCSPGIVPDDSDQLQFTVSETVGILNPQTSALSVYPNPTSDFLTVGNPNSTFQILSIEGKQVMQGAIPSSGVLDIRSLPVGLYVLEIETEATIGRTSFNVSR